MTWSHMVVTTSSKRRTWGWISSVATIGVSAAGSAATSTGGPATSGALNAAAIAASSGALGGQLGAAMGASDHAASGALALDRALCHARIRRESYDERGH